MPTINKNKFDTIINDLKDYGKKGHEEIKFIPENKGQLIPATAARPNWFFRLIRWICGKSYQHFKACEKTVKFLDENRAYLLGKGDIATLNKQFSNFASKKEVPAINGQFLALFQHIDADLIEEQKKNIKVHKTVSLDNGSTVLEGDFIGEYMVKGKKTIDEYGFIYIYEGTFEKNKLVQGEKISQSSITTTSWKGTFEKEKLVKGTKNVRPNDGSFVKELKGIFKKENLIEGASTTTYKDGSQIIYSGKFNETSESLEDGTKTLQDGTVEKGLFKYTFLKKGTRTLLDQTVMEGAFEDDELNGLGKITYPDGKIEEGNFVDGLLSNNI